jgi:beta-barrel assembly-enhancing protease
VPGVRKVWGWLLAAALFAQAGCGGLAGGGGAFGLRPGAGDSPRLATGFNLFTPEQDIEVGRLTAEEYAARLRLVEDERVVAYVRKLGRSLAAHAGGYEFPYEFAVVGSGDVNAFALPGGYIFVNAGAIVAAETEGELAAVLAHEIAHVALRHGTNQASKAYLAKRGLSLLEALTGGGDNGVGRFVTSLGSAGAEALFLKFSREAETQADLEGARLLAAAGYDPREMASFFARLKERGVERPHESLSDHPHPAERVAAIRRHAPKLAVGPRPAHDPVEFERTKARLSGRVSRKSFSRES